MAISFLLNLLFQDSTFFLVLNWDNFTDWEKGIETENEIEKTRLRQKNKLRKIDWDKKLHWEKLIETAFAIVKTELWKNVDWENRDWEQNSNWEIQIEITCYRVHRQVYAHYLPLHEKAISAVIEVSLTNGTYMHRQQMQTL